MLQEIMKTTKHLNGNQVTFTFAIQHHEEAPPKPILIVENERFTIRLPESYELERLKTPCVYFSDCFEASRFDKLILKKHHCSPPKKGNIFISLPDENSLQLLSSTIKSTINEYYANNRQKFTNSELKIELKWLQEVSNYDYPTMALNRWTLSHESKNNIVRLFGKNFELFPAPFFDKAYKWAEKNNKFIIEEKEFTGWSTVTLKNKILILDFPTYESIQNYITPQELKLLAKQAEQAQELLSNPELLYSSIFTDKVHVNEEGYFSNCPDFCDDCSWIPHLIWNYIKDLPEIRKKCETFIVRSRKGKAYTYYSPNPEVLQELANIHHDVVEKRKKELQAKIQTFSLLTPQ